MNAFIWNSMILLCNISAKESDKVNTKCITYMVSCYNGERSEKSPFEIFLICQNQYLQLENSMNGTAPDQKLLKRDG